MNPAEFPGVCATSHGVRIAGQVCAVPRRVVSNEFFEGTFARREIDDVVKMIGVHERRWVEPGQTTSDLCLLAARDLIAELGWDPGEIGLIVLVTQTSDYALPASACVLHGKLGLGPRCAAFDVNLGCSGYVYGLWLVSQLLQAHSTKRALLLVGDTSYYSDHRDRSTALLFGDAGCATGIESAEGAPDWRFVLGTDGAGARNLMVPKSGTRQEQPDEERMTGRDPSKLFMDGGEIFNFTLRAIPPLQQALLAYSETDVAAFDAFLFHQANAFMIKHLAKKLKLPSDRVPMNMARFGNTSSASVPLLMCDEIAESLRSRAMRLAMFGFGVGYSWAAGDVPCGPLAVLKTVEL